MEPENKESDVSGKKSHFDDLSRDDLISKCKGLLLIAQKAKHAKSELQNEYDNLKCQLQSYSSELKVNENNVKVLQELVDSLTEQKLSYITEIDTTKRNLTLLDGKYNALLDVVKKHETDLSKKHESLVVATQKLSVLDSEIISLKRQNNRLLDENEQLINQLTELESRTAEFNNIGLQQREQLQMLENNVESDMVHERKIKELTERIEELEKTSQCESVRNTELLKNNAIKIEELSNLYESEKIKREKANVKLRVYKDKILKCATCINQLKGSRYILTKTIEEYSQNIPKWQSEIVKASKVLDSQLNELNNENISLNKKLQQLECQISDLLKSQNLSNNENQMDLERQLSECQEKNASLKTELTEAKSKCDILNEANSNLSSEKNILNDNINELKLQITSLSNKNNELFNTIQDLNNKNKELNETLQKKEIGMNDEKFLLQIKALESEKAILVKEKLNARDTVVELENQSKMLNNEIEKIKSELTQVKQQAEALQSENVKIKEKHKNEKQKEVEKMKSEMIKLQAQYDNIKKEYDDLLDLNGLLREEIETLKLSLEQPKDDAENYSEINVSLQADIVRLETKLTAYKQENASLLAEIKESRIKSKEFDNLVLENDNVKSKLASYKTENAELLNEMKEINQVLKERGEAIFKLQKAIAEMERLIETLEKDREGVKEERDMYLKKIELLEKDIKNAERNSNENNKAIEEIIIERDNALKSLAEKDAVIVTLKEEMEKLKQHSSGVDLPNEDMSTSTISKAEEHARMKDLDETFEDKYTKLRIFALKLKKKLNETTGQLQVSEQEKVKLKKFINDKATLDNDFVDSQSIEESSSKTREISDLEAKVKCLTDNLEHSTKASAKLEEIEAELRLATQKLQTEIEAHKITKEQLEKALRDVKRNNVLSLEMEDYERSMKDLTNKMDESKKKIVQMESTIDTQEGTIIAMKTQIKLLEEQIKTEEAQNRLIKEELVHATEDIKEKENIINAKKDLIAKLMQDLEDEKRKNEECDLEMTSLISEKEKIIMLLGEEKIELNNKIKKLEFKCAEFDEKCRITNIELADLKTEYASYKVRAQAVLRQNQTVDHSQEEQLKEEAAALKAQMETVTTKLTTVQEQCEEVTAELEVARKRAAEASAEASRANQRTARLHADLTRLVQQLDAEQAQHKLQISTLTQCYKSQIADLEAKLQKETESYKKQIASLQESAKMDKSLADVNRDKYLLPVIAKDEGSEDEMDINVSLIPREEGEGSESAPSPPLSKSFLASGSSRRSPVPLERLLEEGVPEDDALDPASFSFTPDQEISDLKRKLQAQQQRVKHVTVLLAESERECARMAQLSELLKAELRRVRGDAHATHNTEYMKNVTLKFLTLPPGDERGRLVPVLQKILTLSPEETNKMHAIAKGLDPNPNKGWGSYLPWPGGK